MADLFPQNFPTPSASAIASYPYTDIKEGTGYVQYIVSRIQVNATASNDEYRLITDSGIITNEEGGNPWTVLDASDEFNFDVLFNTAKVVNGKLIGVMSFESSGGAITPKLRVLKWDGSTETELAAQVTYQATGASGQYVVTALITVTNKKINAGESLRIELVTTDAGDGKLWHDTQASQSAHPAGGRTSFFVPFKLLE